MNSKTTGSSEKSKHNLEDPTGGKIKVPYLKPRYLPDGLLNNRFARTRLGLQAIGILTNPQDKRYLCFKANPPFCPAFKILPSIPPFLWPARGYKKIDY